MKKRAVQHTYPIFSIALLLLTTLADAQLPRAIAPLEEFATSETELVAMARRIDLQQKSLVSWDSTLIEQYMQSGNTDLAASTREGQIKRMQTIGQIWEYVLERYPNNARANTYYGEYLYDYTSDRVAAMNRWRVAVKLDNKFAPVHNNLGLHYFHEGNYAKGVEHIQKAIDLDKNNPDFLFNMVQLYLNHYPQLSKILKVSREKIYRDAMKMSKKAAELLPDDFEMVQDYAVNFFAAENFEIEADWQESARAWQAAQTVAPDEDRRFYSLLNEARVWLRAGRKEPAQEALTKALAIHPDNKVALNLNARARQ